MRIILSLLLMIVFYTVGAQTRLKPEDIEVRDSSGTVYPTVIWTRLTASGRYTLRMQPGGKTAILSRLSDLDYERRMDQMPRPPESRFFKTGEKIASFNERDINGNKFNLKELTGKVVVLNFWFINCPPCRQEIPDLNELADKYRDNPDVVFIAVALDAKYDINDFLKTNPFRYHIIDDGRYIASRYGINSYPTNVVLDKQGKVVFHSTGFSMNTVAWVQKSIAAGLNETITR